MTETYDERRTRLAPLQTELDALNAEWDAITAKRKAWMDEHMADFAKYPIGADLYKSMPDRDSGMFGDYIGKVKAYYRYHAEQRDPRYDRSMDIHYQTDRGDNSSRLHGMVESAEERANRLQDEARRLTAR